MNDELDRAMELAELGDAKEQTKGFPNMPDIEDDPVFKTRQAD